MNKVSLNPLLRGEVSPGSLNHPLTEGMFDRAISWAGRKITRSLLDKTVLSLNSELSKQGFSTTVGAKAGPGYVRLQFGNVPPNIEGSLRDMVDRDRNVRGLNYRQRGFWRRVHDTLMMEIPLPRLKVIWEEDGTQTALDPLNEVNLRGDSLFPQISPPIVAREMNSLATKISAEFTEDTDLVPNSFDGAETPVYILNFKGSDVDFMSLDVYGNFQACGKFALAYSVFRHTDRYYRSNSKIPTDLTLSPGEVGKFLDFLRTFDFSSNPFLEDMTTDAIRSKLEGIFPNSNINTSGNVFKIANPSGELRMEIDNDGDAVFYSGDEAFVDMFSRRNLSGVPQTWNSRGDILSAAVPADQLPSFFSKLSSSKSTRTFEAISNPPLPPGKVKALRVRDGEVVRIHVPKKGHHVHHKTRTPAQRAAQHRASIAGNRSVSRMKANKSFAKGRRLGLYESLIWENTDSAPVNLEEVFAPGNPSGFELFGSSPSSSSQGNTISLKEVSSGKEFVYISETDEVLTNSQFGNRLTADYLLREFLTLKSAYDAGMQLPVCRALYSLSSAVAKEVGVRFNPTFEGDGYLLAEFQNFDGSEVSEDHLNLIPDYRAFLESTRSQGYLNRSFFSEGGKLYALFSENPGDPGSILSPTSESVTSRFRSAVHGANARIAAENHARKAAAIKSAKSAKIYKPWMDAASSSSIERVVLNANRRDAARLSPRPGTKLKQAVARVAGQGAAVDARNARMVRRNDARRAKRATSESLLPEDSSTTKAGTFPSKGEKRWATKKDAENHMTFKSDHEVEIWLAAANNSYNSKREKGGSPEDCEAYAIPVANSAVSKFRKKNENMIIHTQTRGFAPGPQLTPRDQEAARALYVSRKSADPFFADDARWMRNSIFPIREDGSLDTQNRSVLTFSPGTPEEEIGRAKKVLESLPEFASTDAYFSVHSLVGPGTLQVKAFSSDPSDFEVFRSGVQSSPEILSLASSQASTGNKAVWESAGAEGIQLAFKFPEKASNVVSAPTGYKFTEPCPLNGTKLSIPALESYLAEKGFSGKTSRLEVFPNRLNLLSIDENGDQSAMSIEPASRPRLQLTGGKFLNVARSIDPTLTSQNTFPNVHEASTFLSSFLEKLSASDMGK